MEYYSAAQIQTRAPLGALITALERAFVEELDVPNRHAFNFSTEGDDGLLVAMPAFKRNGLSVVKLFTVLPNNRERKLPNIQAVVLVLSEYGTPVAIMDGTSLTHLRTAAASALASRYLSRMDSARLVIIGDGPIVPTHVAAHCLVRQIRNVCICGRSSDLVQIAAAGIHALVPHVEIEQRMDIAAAVGQADIVSCATNSAVPVLDGDWVRPGTFVDLIGSFSPAKREADDVLISRARIFVDTYAGALEEAGDIIGPLNRGIICRSQIEGELAELIRGRVQGRKSDDEIIVFKSVGTAIEDWAAAALILDGGGAAHGSSLGHNRYDDAQSS
ncbi:MAG: ornithine cyclodeaminase family protein [Alphaproteobacteria bacterium]|nr:ornithine cyclodeaminase family protein [Alphaproteobacteria bacterium]